VVSEIYLPYQLFREDASISVHMSQLSGTLATRTSHTDKTFYSSALRHTDWAWSSNICRDKSRFRAV